MTPKTPVRLCLKDLYHQDVVEMLERETRQFSFYEVEDDDDPLFRPAYEMLWGAFGPQGEMERLDVIRTFLRADPMVPSPSGTYIRYFLIVALDRAGAICGVRDGTVMVNPAYDPSLCVVYLSHIYTRPASRGTVLSYWLRTAPVEIAVRTIGDLGRAGRITVPAPMRPERYYGMRLVLTAEMEYFSPDERQSWQRILFYGRGGFDVINPRHFPYRQPDFRDPAVVRSTGNEPHPFMLLVRRMGLERQAQMPLTEAGAIVRMMYDDFASHCDREYLENSLQVVLDRLDARAKSKSYVELLPLPTGPKDIHRFKALFRYDAYRRHYRSAPETLAYLNGPVREAIRANPRYLEDALTAIATELRQRPRAVYPSRERSAIW